MSHTSILLPLLVPTELALSLSLAYLTFSSSLLVPVLAYLWCRFVCEVDCFRLLSVSLARRSLCTV